MADIVMADNLKFKLRAFKWALKHELKKNHNVTMQSMEHDLDYCGNPVIGRIWKQIKEDTDKIQEPYQKSIAREFPMIILWILYNDTAYSPIFFHSIVKILETPNLLEMCKEYYVEPVDWYVNRWHKTLENTAKLKAEGKLPDMQGQMGYDEKFFTPPIQNYRHKPVMDADNETLKRIQENLKKAEAELKK